MFISIVLFYQIIIRPILSYAVLAFCLLNLIYLTLKRYNVYYKNFITPGSRDAATVGDEDSSDDEDDLVQIGSPNSQAVEIKNSITVLLYAYIAVFFFVGLNDVFLLDKWVPFWAEAYASLLLWITYRVDNLLEHQETFARLFHTQEVFFKNHVRPVLRLILTKVTSWLLSACLYFVECILDNGLVEKEEAARMRKELDHTSMLCAKAAKSKSSTAQRLRKSMHTLR